MNRNRWLMLALIVSLAGNLILAGFIAGKVYGGSQWWPAADHSRTFRFPLGALPRERRAEFRAELRRNLDGSWKHLRQTQRAVAVAAGREQFDRAALEGALLRFRTELQTSQEKAHASLVDLMNSMTPDERRRAARAMQRHARGPRPLRGPPDHPR